MMKAPFPWFGGKSRVAPLVWEHFGDVANYVEPFAGSLAVLLGRPDDPGMETVNDIDCYLSNFWRSLQTSPNEVAKYADWPVNEADLQARHTWLLQQSDFREKMKSEPDFFDAKIAGWWVWGMSAWIGGGWCDVPGYERRIQRQKVAVSQQIPRLGTAGAGVHRKSLAENAGLLDYFYELADRLRRVRVCCGDWTRVVGPAVTYKNGGVGDKGITGIFFDPPYSAEAGRANSIYACEDLTVAHDVRKWAIENGDNPRLRIAFCGYQCEHDFPQGWKAAPWKAAGGYGNHSNGTGRKNKTREVVWFSPHCLKMGSDNFELFSEGD